jgi:hypothetical protein
VAGEVELQENQPMSPRARAPIPSALLATRRQFDRWRGGQPGRARLPKELWRQAVTLAGEHGIHRTACALGLKYHSLKKHVAEMTVEPPASTAAIPDFIEFPPQLMSSGAVECTIEWSDNTGTKVRMYLKGASLADLASLARVFRGGPA